MEERQEPLKGHQHDGYRDLWSSVVLLAVSDATTPISLFMIHKHSHLAKATREARLWFENASQDYYEVCLMAGVDGDMLRDRTLPKIKEAAAKDQAAEDSPEYQEAMKFRALAAEVSSAITGNKNEVFKPYVNQMTKTPVISILAAFQERFDKTQYFWGKVFDKRGDSINRYGKTHRHRLAKKFEWYEKDFKAAKEALDRLAKRWGL